MKKLKTILLTSGLIFFVFSCSRSEYPSATELLSNTAMQDSIMTHITNDHLLLANMINHMASSGPATQMMTQNGMMMQGMINMAAQDSTSGHNMMSMMMQHQGMMTMMMNMMMQNPDAAKMMMSMIAQNPEATKMMQGMIEQKGMMGRKNMMQ